LRGAGYGAPMTSVANGVASYVERLIANEQAPAVM
jgi:hypothetical protein